MPARAIAVDDTLVFAALAWGGVLGSLQVPPPSVSAGSPACSVGAAVAAETPSAPDGRQGEAALADESAAANDSGLEGREGRWMQGSLR